MKLDLKRLYVVTKPTQQSVLIDVFQRVTTLGDLFSQVRGGLTIEQVHAIYTTSGEALAEARRILKQKKATIYTNAGTKIKKGEGYAIFLSHVSAKDKYKTNQVTIFRSRKQAQKTVDEYIANGVFKKSELKILKY